MAHSGVKAQGNIFFTRKLQIVINLLYSAAVLTDGVILTRSEQYGDILINIVIPILARNLIKNCEKVFIACCGENEAAVFVRYIFVNMLRVG